MNEQQKAFKTNYQLSWQQFSSIYKKVKHFNEIINRSIYGEYSHYLHMLTKKRVFVKQISFISKQQSDQILSQVYQSLKYQQFDSLCKFLKYTIQYKPIVKSNTKSYFQQQGQSYLIYQNYKSLQQITQHILSSNLNDFNTNPLTLSLPNKSKTGLSPSKYISVTHQHPSCFSQQTIISILTTLFAFIKFLRFQNIQTIKSFTLQMIQIQKFSEVDQQVKIFYLPSLNLQQQQQQSIIQMVKDNLIKIEDSFIGQQVLRLVNQAQEQKYSNRTMQVAEGSSILIQNLGYPNIYKVEQLNSISKYPKQQQNNLFANIHLGNQLPSPTFNFSKHHHYQQQQSFIRHDFYIDLSQSLGLLLTRLICLSLGKQTYQQLNLYKMDSQYLIVIDYDQIKAIIKQLDIMNKYSKGLTRIIEKLVLNTKQFQSLQQIQELIQNLLKQKNNFSNSRMNKSRKIINLSRRPNQTQHQQQGTPSKKVTLKKNNQSNKSKIQFNKTLNENQKNQRKSIIKPKQIIPRSVSRSNSQSNSRSRYNHYISKSKSRSKLNQTKSINSSFIVEKQDTQNKGKNNIRVQYDKLTPSPFVHNESSNKKLSNLSEKQFNTTQKSIISSNFSISPGPHRTSSLDFPTLGSQRDQTSLLTHLKQRILCDSQNRQLPNIIEKTFRDGSTYIGQYNPQANTKQGNGLYFYHEGDIYGGTWSNDQLNGLGVYLFANGDYYQGHVKNGQKQGEGIYKYKNGNVYQGQWFNDKKHGYGQYHYQNGQIYIGNFQNGHRHGNGIFTYPTGDIYEGYFVKNLKHGHGIFKQAKTGNILEGRWQNDKLLTHSVQNQLKYTNSGNLYIGQTTENGLANGKGRITFKDGTIYEGQLRMNTYQGNCYIQFSNGDTYKGEIKNNNFQGYGEYLYASKRVKYFGQWYQSRHHGEGKLLNLQNNSLIHCNWQMGQACYQHAIITYQNGQRYEGYINYNGKHGKGTYYWRDGKTVTGLFENNNLKLIQKIQK